MAIDSASKRRSVASVMRWGKGPGVTPDVNQPVAWRIQVGRSYSGFVPVEELQPSEGLINQWLNWWTMSQSPYNKSRAITKSDTVDFVEGPCDAIYVGGAGIVVVVHEDNNTSQFTAVAGEILPVKAKRVNSTSTTATLMLALYQV